MQLFARFLALAAAAAPFLTQAAPVSAVAGQVVPGKWIITLTPEADIATIAAHKERVRAIHASNIARRSVSEEETGGIEREYGFGEFNGYAGSFDTATIEELRTLPEVSKVKSLLFFPQKMICQTVRSSFVGLGSQPIVIIE